jgi:hypothetical protein
MRRDLVIGALVAGVFVLAGTLFLVVGVRHYTQVSTFVRTAEQAPGRVVGFERWRRSMDTDEVVVRSIVEFRARDGTTVRFRGPEYQRLGRKHRVGDAVVVYYNPRKPSEARVASFAGLWFPSCLMLVVGLFAVSVPPFTMYRVWTAARRAGGNRAAAA